MPPKNFDYEKSMQKLEEIVEKFESGKFKSLDDSVKSFKTAMDLATKCKEHLTKVENTITTLKEKFDGEDIEQSSLDLD